MKRTILYALALTVLAATPAWADSNPGDDRPAIETCGHGQEMQSARDALAAGDTERALQHLKDARAILVECERRVTQEAELAPSAELGRDLI